jgi:hypothetical protein
VSDGMFGGSERVYRCTGCTKRGTGFSTTPGMVTVTDPPVLSVHLVHLVHLLLLRKERE